jgi:membrane protease YdiL (CAAX protease family)
VTVIPRADSIGAVLFLVLWGGSTAYLGATGGDWTFPLVALLIFGAGLSGVAWLTTRGVKTTPIAVDGPRRESLALVVYMALYAIFFLGYGMGALRETIPAGRGQEIAVLLVKLVVHVVLPAVLLLALGARIRPLLRSQLPARQFWLTLLVLGAIITALLAVVSPSLSEIGAVDASVATLAWAAPVAFVWLAVEAGLNEEFLFRAVLQTRLSAWFNSDLTGIVVTSVIFGLGHAPGLFLRGGPGIDGWSTDPWQVIAFTIATLAPLSLFVGFVYARTKSLLLCVLLHAAVDFLPNLADFLTTWAV